MSAAWRLAAAVLAAYAAMGAAILLFRAAEGWAASRRAARKARAAAVNLDAELAELLAAETGGKP